MKRILRALSSYSLATVAGAIGIFGFSCLIALSLYEDRQGRTEHARRETENIARVLEAHSLAAFQKIEILLAETAGDLIPDDLRGRPERTSPRVEAMNRLLKSRLARVPEAGVLQVANEHGDYVFSSLSPVPDVNIADRPFFLQQKERTDGGMVISEPLLSRTLGGAPAVSLSKRINHPDGSFAGVVNVVVLLDQFEVFYRTINLGPRGADAANYLNTVREEIVGVQADAAAAGPVLKRLGEDTEGSAVRIKNAFDALPEDVPIKVTDVGGLEGLERRPRHAREGHRDDVQRHGTHRPPRAYGRPRADRHARPEGRRVRAGLGEMPDPRVEPLRCGFCSSTRTATRR